MSISVLYIHHCGVFGGASRSLLELIKAFPEGEVKPYLITQKGKVSEVFRQQGIEVIDTLGLSQFDHTRFGFYQSKRWLILLRECAYIPFNLVAIFKARRQWKKIDIVHVNEITNVVSIILGKIIFQCQFVVHIRSVQQVEKGLLRRKFVLWLLNQANVLIAIDSTVRHSLPIERNINIIHNGFNASQKFLVKNICHEGEFSLRPMKIVFIGGLVVMKGILEFLQAAKICADNNMNVKFIVIGDIPRPQKGIIAKLLNQLGFSYDVLGYCKDYIKQHQLEQIIEFSGFTLDIEQVYIDTDILCFPSHLNAVGRPVIEAALFKVPSIVAIQNLAEDMIIHNQTGLCIGEKNSMQLFKAIEHFYQQPSEINRMGDCAFQLAQKNFDIQKNANKVLSLYKKSLDQGLQ